MENERECLKGWDFQETSRKYNAMTMEGCEVCVRDDVRRWS